MKDIDGDGYILEFTGRNEFNLVLKKGYEDIVISSDNMPRFDYIISIENLIFNQLILQGNYSYRIKNSEINCIESEIKKNFQPIEFNGGKYKKIHLPKHQVIGIKTIVKDHLDKLIIGYTKDVEDPYNFSGFDLDEFELNSEIKYANRKLENIKAKKLRLIGIKQNVNDGELLFSNIEIKNNGEIEFNEVNCNHYRFMDCDFSKVTLRIESFYIDRITSFKVRWFKKIINEDGNEFREHYREFKTHMINQNDRISELYFKAKEFDAYKKGLKWEKGSRGNKILLCLNKVTNDHGLKWWRPIWWILGFGLLFVPYYYLADFDQCTKESIFNHWGKFFMFLNPTHSVDLFKDVEYIHLKQCNYVIDFFHRIFNTYFYYQFIAAFRKFGKT